MAGVEVRSFVRCTPPDFIAGGFIAQVISVLEDTNSILVFDGSRFVEIQMEYCEPLKTGQVQFDFVGRIIMNDTPPPSGKDTSDD